MMLTCKSERFCYFNRKKYTTYNTRKSKGSKRRSEEKYNQIFTIYIRNYWAKEWNKLFNVSSLCFSHLTAQTSDYISFNLNFLIIFVAAAVFIWIYLRIKFWWLVFLFFRGSERIWFWVLCKINEIRWIKILCG